MKSSIRRTRSFASGRMAPISSRARATIFRRRCSQKVQGPMSKVGSNARQRDDLGIATLDFGRRVRGAYTLMELLLVLAIIVIVAAAAAPSFRGVMRSAALKSA